MLRVFLQILIGTIVGLLSSFILVEGSIHIGSMVVGILISVTVRFVGGFYDEHTSNTVSL